MGCFYEIAVNRAFIARFIPDLMGLAPLIPL